MDQSVGNLLRRASRGLSRRLEQEIERGGLSIGVWYYLRVLWEEDGLSQSELCERLGVMGPTTVNAVDRLERMGLIVRERAADDKRKVLVCLTDRGRALEAEMAPIAIDVVEQATEGMSAIERQELARLLTMIDVNMRSDKAKDR